MDLGCGLSIVNRGVAGRHCHSLDSGAGLGSAGRSEWAEKRV